jgi:hypothetical protein
MECTHLTRRLVYTRENGDESSLVDDRCEDCGKVWKETPGVHVAGGLMTDSRPECSGLKAACEAIEKNPPKQTKFAETAEELRSVIDRAKKIERAAMPKYLAGVEQDDAAFRMWHAIACPLVALSMDNPFIPRGVLCTPKRDKWDEFKAISVAKVRAWYEAAFSGQTCRDAYEDFREWEKETCGTPFVDRPSCEKRVRSWLEYEAACAKEEETRPAPDPLTEDMLRKAVEMPFEPPGRPVMGRSEAMMLSEVFGKPETAALVACCDRCGSAADYAGQEKCKRCSFGGRFTVYRSRS